MNKLLVKQQSIKFYILIIIAILLCFFSASSNVIIGVGGQEEIRITFSVFTLFIAGLAVGGIAILLDAIPKIFTNTSVLLYTLPSFLVVLITGYDLRPMVNKDVFNFIGLSSLFTFREQRFPVETSEKTIVTPLFGYLTEFILGILVVIIIVTVIRAIKNNTIKNFLEFKPIYLVALVVPFITGFFDFLSITVENKVTYSPMRDPNLFQEYIKPILPQYMLLSVSMIIAVLLFKNINIPKMASIIGIIIPLSYFLIILYQPLIFDSINTTSFFIKTINVSYLTVMPLVVGSIVGISIRSLIPLKKTI